jgi:hypothetical protein
MTKTWAAVSAAVLALVMIGCFNPVIGQECVLVTKDVNGNPVQITESQIAGEQKDIVSVGAPECEDLVCVRSANHWPTGVDPNAYAVGECSRPCSPNDQSRCLTGTDVDTSADAFTCRALVLDAEVLAAYRASHTPEEYERIFGNTESPYFCARQLPESGF